MTDLRKEVVDIGGANDDPTSSNYLPLLLDTANLRLMANSEGETFPKLEAVELSNGLFDLMSKIGDKANICKLNTILNANQVRFSFSQIQGNAA